MSLPDTEPLHPAAEPSVIRHAAGVAAGGIAGTVANALMIAIFLPVSAIALMASPGRYVVGIVLAAALPFLFRRLGGVLGWVAGVVLLSVLATLLAKLFFGGEGTWSAALAFNAVYALACVLIYRYVAYGRA